MPFESAEWIGGGNVFRHTFTAPGGGRLQLRISALGLFFAELNGRRLSDELLVPVQSNYRKIVYFLEYDLNAFLRSGENELLVYVGEGFYAQSRVLGAYGWAEKPYGPRKLIAELLCDGRTFATTSSVWLCTEGPWIADNVYAGEEYDARREIGAETIWKNAVPTDSPGGIPCLQPIPGERTTRRLAPVGILSGGEGRWLFDFGENIAGRTVLKLSAPRGTEIVLRYAEELDEDGKIDFSSTGEFATGCIPTDRYICRGNGPECWGAMFGYRGFRYVEVSGWSGEAPPPDFLTAEEIHTFLRETGTFSSDDPLLDRIWRMACRTLDGNLHGLPTDCPIREKCGWLGDAQVIACWSDFRYDMREFWRKYCRDIETSVEGGAIPMVAPGSRACGEATVEWAVAIVEIPYLNYCFYGDTAILERNYPLMQSLLERLDRLSHGGLIDQGLGDFCPPGCIYPHNTPVTMTSSVYHLHAVRLTERIAGILGRTDDQNACRQRAAGIAAAISGEFYRPEQRSFGSQTADVLALYFGLAPDPAAVAATLHTELLERHGHFTTGIFGFKYLFEALCNAGYPDDVLTVLHARGYPGILELIRQGATTFWETWEKYPIDSSTRARSRNHPMKTGFAAFYFRNLGGLRIGPRFGAAAELDYEPVVPRKLGRCRVSFRSIHGEIVSEWQRTERGVLLELTLPEKVKASWKQNASTRDAELRIRRS